jgi:hypothetical protein
LNKILPQDIFREEGNKMIDPREWNWVVNAEEMTCRNEENEVIIKMEKVGENLKGMLHDMPMELFAQIAGYDNGEKIIEKIVKMAEEKYINITG